MSASRGSEFGTFQSKSSYEESGTKKQTQSAWNIKNKIPKAVRSNWVTYLAAIVAVVLGIVMSIWYKMSDNLQAADSPLVNLVWEFKTVDADGDHHNFATPSMDHSANWYGGVAVLVLSWMTLIPPVFELASRMLGFFKYQVGRNIYRWLPDSLITPLLAVCLVTTLGDVNTFGVFSTFVLVHVVTIGGLSLESMNAPDSLQLSEVKRRNPDDEDEGYEDVAMPRTTVTFYPLLFAVWVSLLSIVVPITLMATTVTLEYVSAYEWVAIAMYFLYCITNSIIQIQYYRSIYMPTYQVTPFKKTGEGCFSVDNYERYQSMMHGSAMVWRTAAILFLASALSMPNYYYFPQVVQSNSMYSVCRPMVDPVQPTSGTSINYLVRAMCSEASTSVAFITSAGYTGVENVNPGDKLHNRALASVDPDKSLGNVNQMGNTNSLKASYQTTASEYILSKFPEYCLAIVRESSPLGTTSVIYGDNKDFNKDECKKAQAAYLGDSSLMPIYSSCVCTALSSTSTNTYNPNVWANDKLGKGKDIYNIVKVDKSGAEIMISYLGQSVIFGFSLPTTKITDPLPYDSDGKVLPAGTHSRRALAHYDSVSNITYMIGARTSLDLDITKSGFIKNGLHRKW